MLGGRCSVCGFSDERALRSFSASGDSVAGNSSSRSIAEQAAKEADEKGGGARARDRKAAAQPEPEQRPCANHGQPERRRRAEPDAQRQVDEQPRATSA